MAEPTLWEIYGIYHSVSPKHLHRYCGEFEYRYNTRKISESVRFDKSLLSCNRRLRYKDLIAIK
ncbi:MAG: transposase [Bacteroidetes bacterium]|nr:transposase [Bacteroidota bacterium]